MIWINAHLAEDASVGHGVLKGERDGQGSGDWFHEGRQAKVKGAVGKAVGDAKLETEGKADEFEGKAQNAVGGVKDALRGE